MSNKKRMSAEERREQILETASDVFAEKGFSGARTKEIASRAGISETLIYKHFSTKEELYASAIMHLHSGHPMHEDMREPLARGDDEALLYSIALHMIVHTSEDPRIVRLHLYQMLDEPPGPVKSHSQAGGVVGMLSEYFKGRMDDGSFIKGDPVFVAKLFLYMVFMAVVDRYFPLVEGDLDMDDESLARELTKCFLKGQLVR